MVGRGLLVNHCLATAARRAHHVAAERVHDARHVAHVLLVVLQVVHLYLPDVCARHILQVSMGLMHLFLTWVGHQLSDAKHLSLVESSCRLAEEIVRHGLVELGV